MSQLLLAMVELLQKSLSQLKVVELNLTLNRNSPQAKELMTQFKPSQLQMAHKPL